MVEIDVKNFAGNILFLRSLANEERMKILALIIKKPVPAQEIEKLFYMEQSTASYHLNMMRRAGILSCHKEGKRAIYSYNEGSLDNQYSDFLRNIKK